MPTPVTDEQWKERYRELVREFEEKERAWTALESALRSAAGKLAMAALGQNPKIDAAIEEVVHTLRANPNETTLDTSLSGLVRALYSHNVEDRPRPSGSSDEPRQALGPLLKRLLKDLGRIGPLAQAASALARRLDAGIGEEGWEAFLRSVAESVAVVIDDLRSQRRELEEFLDQVTRQLADFEGWSKWQVGDAQSRLDDSASLEKRMQTEMRGLTDEVDASPDVTTLKVRVQARLNVVAQQLREFREKEEERHAESERRAQELRTEVTKLKGRTDELLKLCAEQETKLMIDELTGAHSRYAYERRLEEEFQRWRRHGQPLTFSIWDIDYFKRINDEYGHDAGDRLLRAVADLFTKKKRGEDFLARVGGEEFVLLLPMTTAEPALRMADKLRTSIASAGFHRHGRPVAVTISCGLTEFRQDDTPQSVYERADRALYQAKQAGRNRCVSL
jgi:diguanylate cyclase